MQNLCGTIRVGEIDMQTDRPPANFRHPEIYIGPIKPFVSGSEWKIVRTFSIATPHFLLCTGGKHVLITTELDAFDETLG